MTMKLTEIDIIKMLGIIRVNYSNAFVTKSDEEEQILIESWYDILKGYDKDIVFIALKKSMETSEFAPKIANIVREIDKMTIAFEKSDNDLWNELVMALSNVKYYASYLPYDNGDDEWSMSSKTAMKHINTIYSSLDKYLQLYLKDIKCLIDMSKFDNTQLSIDKGRFLKIMPDIRERQKTACSIPIDIKPLLIKNNMKMLEC